MIKYDESSNTCIINEYELTVLINALSTNVFELDDEEYRVFTELESVQDKLNKDTSLTQNDNDSVGVCGND